MAFAKKTFPPEQIAAARRLYEDGLAPLHEVAALLQISKRTLEARIKEWAWPPRSADDPEREGRAVRKARSGRAGPRSNVARKQQTDDARPQRKRGSRQVSPQKPKSAHEKPPATREALAIRIQRVVERELYAIDRVLSALGAADSTEAERSARTLASLARALKEVMRLTAPEQADEADDDDSIPRDLEDFRRELARKLEALGAGAEADAAGDGG